jgi:signal transduction histidine kinase
VTAAVPLAVSGPPAHRGLSATTWFGVGVVVALGLVHIGFDYQNHYEWTAWAGVVTSICFAATWAVLRGDRAQVPNAGLCLLASMLEVLTNVGVGYVGPLWLIAALTNALSAIPITTLLLRYPYTRIPRLFDRWFVVVLAAWLITTSILLVVTWTADPTGGEWWPTLVHGNHWQTPIAHTTDVGEMLMAVVGLGLVVRRVVSAHGPDRSALLPVAIAGVVYALAALGLTTFWILDSPAAVSWMGDLGQLAAPLVPLAFLGVAIQRRVGKARIADLAARIGAADQPEAGPHGLRVELRRALADPALDVRYWIDGEWVDSEGNAMPDAPPGRSLVPITAHDGSVLAELYVDPVLEHHRDLLDGAVAATGLALQNARLQAALLAQLTQIRSAQQRIVEAGLQERRRIERDLHDGAQQRLLAASMTLARAEGASDHEAAILATARLQLREALAELRELARGIHPAILSQSGVRAAAESLVEHSATPVYIDIPDRRWAPAVESTSYFVIAEGLANVSKHAPGATVSVDVREMDQALRVSVQDDGPGTADPGGPGLTGLADRVHAIGGELTVHADPGRGTELEAIIPCG